MKDDMEEITLRTVGGDFVASAYITCSTAYEMMPDAIIWGVRVFTKEKTRNVPVTYFEVVAKVISDKFYTVLIEEDVEARLLEGNVDARWIWPIRRRLEEGGGNRHG